ncbi:ATP-dependent helicase [Helicobacter fennelliae]|uniref:ATP-dependent helicase n=1 Tax=Helicobacter fennelliae TaxID=215 RepID=UPI000DF942AF|nr:UvrD-helicase domain-containing protein [Helicobacter fennelliae]STQ84033.1 ATP-dependent DNA helicase [Helicobacter fennelliae]
MSKILSSLNPSQQQALMHIDGALLILAGAGSGKTKTLTSRLAYLIKEVGIPPSSTLTLTFTNKAANEMRQRALSLLEDYEITTPPLLCTFHRFGLLFLKFYIHHLGREANFVLIDSDDQKKIIRKIDDTIPTSDIVSFISSQKNAIITPAQSLQNAKCPPQKMLAHIYQQYQNFLESNNMVDFDDLLLLSYQILESNENLAKEISQQYSYIMVDEYQDTNLLQVALLHKLCSTHQNICIVGDDDQSIYSWRGADIGYILNFTQSFDNAKIIKLQTNYRSKAPILQAANKLIAHNHSRLGKELESVRGEGEAVAVISSFDENKEADTIANEIKKLIVQGTKPQEIAILFRLNALSRGIEAGLNRAHIPYKIIGTTRFYERAEIKDVLAYFRLVLNINDDFSLSRIINTPRRGIGKQTESRIFESATHLSLSVFEALRCGKLDSILSPTQKQSLEKLFQDIEDLALLLKSGTLKFLEQFQAKIDVLGKNNGKKNKHDEIDREANIGEFFGYFRDYIIHNPDASLEDFLNDLSLSSDLDSPIDESVCAMSVHSSKGLEFEYVFVIGLEEDVFPLNYDGVNIEEERRLGYVAFTRAKEKLILSSVDSRFRNGKRTQLTPSRFLFESQVLQSKNSFQTAPQETSFQKGDVVLHKIFGSGVIKEVQDDKLMINFGGNIRMIMSDFVKKI